ncbi:MAG: glycosyltransferase, partial [Candidatus Binatia bacterium]
RDLGALRRLYELIRREKPSIVETHTGKAGLLGRVAARLAGVPVVVHTFHGHVLHSYYGPLRTLAARRMEAVLARWTDRLLVVSDRVGSELAGYGIGSHEQIRVIPLALDLEELTQAAALRGELRGELGIEPESFLIGIVGRLFPIKNHELFLEAAARVARAEPSARFIVVGDGPRRRELEQEAARLGIAGKTFFTGWRRDLPRIYGDLDVLVVSSKNEGTPVSAIEAMSAGVPVVATSVGGLPDLVAHGETGLLTRAGDPEELAGAILRLRRDPAMAERIRAVARSRVLDRFALSRLVQEMDELYRGLLLERKVVTS